MTPSNAVSVKPSSLLAKVKSGKVKAVAAKSSKRRALVSALKPKQTTPRLLFAMDATGSREHSWEIAQSITLRLFQQIPSELEVALAHFGGNRLREVTPYTQDAATFIHKVKQVKCEYGGTSINEVLSEATNTQGLKALVIIGDCFEEDEQQAYAFARQLKLSGVKCFLFHDRSSARLGYDVRTARTVFATIVDITGGALLDFNDQAATEAGDLLQAIAVLASAGRKALENSQRALPGAQQLLGKLQP